MNDMPRNILGVEPTALSFAMPAGACDCHTHIFGPDDKFPLSPERLYTPGPASIKNLNALHKAIHVERVVVVHPSPYGTDNAVTVDAVRKMGARARGVAVIDETTTETMLDDMHEAGMRGVRVNIESHGAIDSAVAGELFQRAAERVARLGWHVQTYTNIGVLAPLADTILKLPVPLVVDHFGRPKAELGVGQPGFAELLTLVKSGKVYVKISAPYRISQMPGYPDALAIARALIEANADRIVWGTDWPHPGGPRRDPKAVEPFRAEDNGAVLNRLKSWTRNETELRKILVDNPARLYQF